MSQAMLASNIPAYITARSANSIISDSRPTRIQSETLSFLNRILDELLLFVVASSKSLATDRIKTDGLLKVLNNNALAKDAVLEAELELRTYLESQKAEGGRVPLGLSATSRWDGTEAFPVASAYAALRTRCQYYSTLGDREDESVTGDQHIMSAEGRPIATITPGVSVYVTALLEYIGEHILQNVSRVIERDNSDEATLIDLKSAIEEDESMTVVWRQMLVKKELERRMSASFSLGGGAKRTSRPWKVPEANELDEAASGSNKFQRSQTPRSGTAVSATTLGMGRSSSSTSGHGGDSSPYGFREYTNDMQSYSSGFDHGSDSLGGNVPSSTAAAKSDQDQPLGTSSKVQLSRRRSTDKSLTSLFSGKRRGSLRVSKDLPFAGINVSKSPTMKREASQDSVPLDDFEALVMSDQTMRLSLTPNRLHTIDLARDEADEKKVRQRPGTLNMANVRNVFNSQSGGTSTAMISPEYKEAAEESSSRLALRLPGSPATTRRSNSRVSNPPSSYRSPDGLSAVGSPKFPKNSEDVDSSNRLSVNRSTSQEYFTSRSGGSGAPGSPLAFPEEPLHPPILEASAANRDGRRSPLPPNPSPLPSTPSVLEERGDRRRYLVTKENVESPLGRKGGRVSINGISSVIAKNGGVKLQVSEQDTAYRPSEDFDREKGLLDDHASDVASSQEHGHGVEAPPSRFNLEEPKDKSRWSHALEQSRPTSSGDRAFPSEAFSEDSRGTSRMAGNESNSPRDSTERYTHSRASDREKGREVDRIASPLHGLSSDEGSPGHPMASFTTLTRSTSHPHAQLEESRPDGPPSRKIPYGRRVSREVLRTPYRRQSSDSTFSPLTSGEKANAQSTPAIGSNLVSTDFEQHGAEPLPSAPVTPSAASIINALNAVHQQLKSCSTVKECQALVADAVAAAMASSETQTDAKRDAQDSSHLNTVGTEAYGPFQTTIRGIQTSPAFSSALQPVLVMSSSYNEEEDINSIAYNENRAVVAWLLGEPESHDRLSTLPEPSQTLLHPKSMSNSCTVAEPAVLSAAAAIAIRQRKVSNSTTGEANYQTADEDGPDSMAESDESASPGLVKGGSPEINGIVPSGRTTPIPRGGLGGGKGVGVGVGRTKKISVSGPNVSLPPPSASRAAVRVFNATDDRS